ncbi:hypothetical protein [Rhodoferax sp.]|uniref:hypothetical protein n=1 Tax=Rhodoferax sp. TaxID=50421 RepID=UPI002ACDFDD2|nr:hypothetical protein [Rhodoferax sp.]MDZ7921952.1 hypothetical protein [Rhodoferax sp.]
MATKKAKSTWIDVKAKLTEVDRAGLLALVQDLYAAGKDNQVFLHARLHLGGDVLKPYKATIDRWLWPDVFKNQDISVAKAKKAIADYKKALGAVEGLAELMVFYCERDSGFCAEVGMDDESHFDALVLMFAQALKTIATLPKTQRPALWGRLVVVRDRSHNIGYGVGESMDELLAEHGVDD